MIECDIKTFVLAHLDPVVVLIFGCLQLILIHNRIMNIHIFITTMLQLGDKWTNYILFAASAPNHTNRIIQRVSQSKNSLIWTLSYDIYILIIIISLNFIILKHICFKLYRDPFWVKIQEVMRQKKEEKRAKREK